MSTITALQCDWESCSMTATEISAPAIGWLCADGERRGAPRTDLCPQHAKKVVSSLAVAAKRPAKKTARMRPVKKAAKSKKR